MARFKLTAEQQRFIKMAERHFDARLIQQNRKPTAFSRYFLEKCSSEQGIKPPRKLRAHSPRLRMLGALEELFGHDNWLIRLFRRW